ncbi:MAG: hypothetical protein JWM95_1573 [Gemmatimonadetes bacterium]|nr:hypothetical protein [Gemmatimonadota bacterium]
MPHASLTQGFQRHSVPGDCLESHLYGDRGTLGVITVDRLTGRKSALTAMHVFSGIGDYPDPSLPSSIQVGSPCANGAGPIVGTLLRGTNRDIDAALIDIDGHPATNELPGIGAVRFWRALSDADDGQPVRMVGAFSGGVQYGTIVAAAMPVPGLGLETGIIVEMSAIHGDSGAPLVDASGYLLGILTGGSSTRQAFCPIGPIFQKLSCQLFR